MPGASRCAYQWMIVRSGWAPVLAQPTHSQARNPAPEGFAVLSQPQYRHFSNTRTYLKHI